MDQVHVVRHKVLVEGRTQRAVARELGIARVTVRGSSSRSRGSSPHRSNIGHLQAWLKALMCRTATMNGSNALPVDWMSAAHRID